MKPSIRAYFALEAPSILSRTQKPQNVHPANAARLPRGYDPVRSLPQTDFGRSMASPGRRMERIYPVP